MARRLAIEPRVALARLFHLRPSARRALRQRARGGVDPRSAARSTSSTTATWRADVALNREAMQHYPFCRLSDTANVLIMPAFHSASISTKMLKELGGATLIGPMLVGLDALRADLLARRQGQRRRQHGGAGRLRHQRVSCRPRRIQAERSKPWHPIVASK